jgi:hypothetical protein
MVFQSNSGSTFILPIEKIQPSQLFINTAKLETVLQNHTYQQLKDEVVLPVISLGRNPVFSDGHTRAYATLLHGITQLRVYWDPDDLDYEMYQECVDWCLAEKITWIGDLKKRIINSQDYDIHWLGRCKTMQEEVLQRRQNKS